MSSRKKVKKRRLESSRPPRKRRRLSQADPLARNYVPTQKTVELKGKRALLKLRNREQGICIRQKEAEIERHKSLLGNTQRAYQHYHRLLLSFTGFFDQLFVILNDGATKKDSALYPQSVSMLVDKLQDDTPRGAHRALNGANSHEEKEKSSLRLLRPHLEEIESALEERSRLILRFVQNLHGSQKDVKHYLESNLERWWKLVSANARKLSAASHLRNALDENHVLSRRYNSLLRDYLYLQEQHGRLKREQPHLRNLEAPEAVEEVEEEAEEAEEEEDKETSNSLEEGQIKSDSDDEKPETTLLVSRAAESRSRSALSPASVDSSSEHSSGSRAKSSSKTKRIARSHRSKSREKRAGSRDAGRERRKGQRLKNGKKGGRVLDSSEVQAELSKQRSVLEEQWKGDREAFRTQIDALQSEKMDLNAKNRALVKQEKVHEKALEQFKYDKIILEQMSKFCGTLQDAQTNEARERAQTKQDTFEQRAKELNRENMRLKRKIVKVFDKIRKARRRKVIQDKAAAIKAEPNVRGLDPDLDSVMTDATSTSDKSKARGSSKKTEPEPSNKARVIKKEVETERKSSRDKDRRKSRSGHSSDKRKSSRRRDKDKEKERSSRRDGRGGSSKSSSKRSSPSPRKKASDASKSSSSKRKSRDKRSSGKKSRSTGKSSSSKATNHVDEDHEMPDASGRSGKKSSSKRRKRSVSVGSASSVSSDFHGASSEDEEINAQKLHDDLNAEIESFLGSEGYSSLDDAMYRTDTFLQGRLSHAMDEQRELRERIAELQKQLGDHDLQKTVTELRSEVETLQAQLEASSAAFPNGSESVPPNVTIAKLRAEREKLERDLAAAKQAPDRKQAVITALISQLNQSATQVSSEQKKHDAERKQWNDQLQSLRSENKKLVTNNYRYSGQLKQMTDQKKLLDVKVMKIEKVMQTKHRRLEELKDENQDLTERLQEMELGLQRSKSCSHDLRSLVTESASKMEGLRAELETHQEALKTAKERQRRLQAEMDVLSDEKRSLLRQIEREKEERRKAEKDIEEQVKEQVLQIQLQNADELLRHHLYLTKQKVQCSVCTLRDKSAILTGCLHLFCHTCLEEAVTSRNRKCPVCKKQFAKSEIKRIHL